jgi:hypothetical protein
MSIIGYSPWKDAASYGEGMGRTIAQALLQMPQIRQQAAIQKGEYGMQVGRYQQEQAQQPLQNQLLQAQVAYEQQRPQLEAQRLANAQQLNVPRANYYNSQTKKNEAETKKLENPAPKAQTPSQTVGMEKNISGMLPDSYQGKPQTVSPEALQYILQAVLKGGSVGGALPQMQHQPVLETNQVPGHLGMSMFGTQPQVTTNRFQMMPPQGQPLNGAPQQQQGMIRVKHPNGQTGSIPADQLQQALSEGYQQIQ